MKLTSKQTAQLKSLAHHLNPVFQIGKDGINENMIYDINCYLTKHELMKISILNNCMWDKIQIEEVLNGQGFNVVQIIGNVVVVYRQNKKLVNSIQLR